MSDERIEKGRTLRREGFGPEGEARWEELNAIDPGHAQSILEYGFGVWARPGLDLKVRELVVIAAVTAQDLSGEVELHVRSALNRGVTRQEIIETIVQCAGYVGFPKTNHALLAAKRVFEQWEEKKEWHAD